MMQDHPRLTAIVLAGQRTGIDAVAEATGVTYKALAPVGGRPMILHVLDALEASPWIGDIFVTLEDMDLVHQEPRLKTYLDEGRIAAAGTSICGSVADAVAEKAITPPFVVVTADHALLTVEMLDHFCRESFRLNREEATDFTLALVGEKTFRAVFPKARRTFLRFRDDSYSGCNMFGFMAPAAFKVLDFWIKIEQERKTPWRLIRAFGVISLIRYLLRLDNLQRMIVRGGHILGFNARAISMPYPEAAIDVDTPQDLVLVEHILATRATVEATS